MSKVSSNQNICANICKVLEVILKSKKCKILGLILLLILTAGSFHENSLRIVKKNYFNGFQMDSEALVYGKILNDKYGLNKDYPYGLGRIKDENNETAYDFKSLEAFENPSFYKYSSQFGLQGHIFSYITNKKVAQAKDNPNKAVGVIKDIKGVISFLAALSLLIISFQLYKIINPLFGVAFFTSVFLSPWIISFANNLYWVIFTWFIPVILGLLIYQNLHNNLKYLLYILFSISICIKSLCGYEYLSSIILFSVCAFLLSPFFDKKLNYKEIFKYLVIFFILSVIGFLAALCIHGYFRGDGDILAGIQSIYKNDVLRRTLGGDIANFDPVYKDSLEASVFVVIAKYIIWNGGLLTKFISGKLAFIALIAISIYILVKQKKTQKEEWLQNIALLIVFALPCLSWLILGKSHSFIHTHMNYVLWYFGFIATLLYIIFQKIIYEIKAIIKND